MDSGAARIRLLFPRMPPGVPGSLREMPVLENKPMHPVPGLNKGLMCQFSQRQLTVKGPCGLKNWTCSWKLKTSGYPANILHLFKILLLTGQGGHSIGGKGISYD